MGCQTVEIPGEPGFAGCLPVGMSSDEKILQAVGIGHIMRKRMKCIYENHQAGH